MADPFYEHRHSIPVNGQIIIDTPRWPQWNATVERVKGVGHRTNSVSRDDVRADYAVGIRRRSR